MEDSLEEEQWALFVSTDGKRLNSTHFKTIIEAPNFETALERARNRYPDITPDGVKLHKP